MPLFERRSSRPVVPRRRNTVHWLKEWTVPVVGGVTPLLLIAINVAAFIVNHLSEFRWTVAVMSFVSGMMLNTYFALNIYRVIQRRWPDWPPVHPRNEELAVVLGMGVVTVLSFVLAWLSYRGLEDARQLPDKFTFIYGAVGMGSLIISKVFFDRDRERYARRAIPAPPRRTVGAPAQGGPPPPPPPATSNQPGYTPPRYLPPS